VLKSQIGLQLWKIGTQRWKLSAWETIRENIKISAKESLRYNELKKHKPWFDEGWPKLQWLQDPSKINGDNLNSVRSEHNRHFRNK
jgi:hypothetical protein